MQIAKNPFTQRSHAGNIAGNSPKAASPPADTISIIRFSASVLAMSPMSKIEPTDMLRVTFGLLSASLGFGTTS